MRNILAHFDSGCPPHEPSFAWRVGDVCGFVPLWIWGMVLFSVSCGAWADAPQRSPAPQAMTTLISRLRAPSFRERLQAEADCRETGPAVLPALVEALKSPDPELRRRAQMLIEQIEVDGLDEAIDAFLAPGSTTTLPGWSLVDGLVEDSPEYRAAFAEILRGNTALARALAHPQLIPAELQRQMHNTTMSMRSIPQALSTANTSAILLMLIHPEANYPADWANMAGQTIRQGVLQGVNPTMPGQLLQALVARWIETPHAGNVSDRLGIAMHLSLPESVSPALEMLSQKTHPHQLNIAFQALMRYGGAAEMSVVEGLLNDPYELNAQRGPDDQKTTSTQLRDLALATVIEMKPPDAAM